MRAFTIVLICLFAGFSCDNSNPDPAPETYRYQQPESIDDGWVTDTLASVGMTELQMADMVDYLNQTENHEIHSVLIVKDHKLVFEVYFDGHDYCYNCANFHGALVPWDMYRRHNTHSATKSITSTLIGIAIDQGHISSVQDKIFDYLPEYMDLWDEEKDRIRIEHLLTMSAGLQWNEWDADISSSSNDIIRLWSVEDPIRFILEKPVVAPPGTRFYYSGGCSNLLGQIIRNATGMSVTAYANSVLFGPLEIGNRNWPRFNNGMEYVSGDVPLTPREMAKLGEVFINDGYWRDTRVVSEEWIDQATQHHIWTTTWDRDGYGFQWWLYPLRVGDVTVESFSARGWAGQYIMCLPELDMVAVFTGGNYTRSEKEPIVNLLERYILPASLGE